MVEPKVRLSFTLPGAVMLTHEECENNPKENYEHHKMTLDVKEKGKIKREILHFVTRKQKSIKQSLSICKEAYQYMISDAGWPEKGEISRKTWAKMTENERLNLHMQLIAESLGGKEFHYEVLED